MDPVEFPPGYKTADQIMKEAREILSKISSDIDRVEEERRKKVNSPKRCRNQDPCHREEQQARQTVETRGNCSAANQPDLINWNEDVNEDYMTFDEVMESFPQTPLVPGGRVVPELLRAYGTGPRSTRLQEAEAYYQNFPDFDPPPQAEVEPYWAQHFVLPEDDLSEFFGQGVSRIPPWEQRTPQEIGHDFDPYWSEERPTRHATYLEELAPTWDEEPQVYRHDRVKTTQPLPREYVEEFDPYHSPERTAQSHSNYEELSRSPGRACPRNSEEERIQSQVDKILQQARSRIANAIVSQDLRK